MMNKKANVPLQDELHYVCPFHIYLKNKQFDTIKEKKGNQVNLTYWSKMKVESIDKVNIK